MTQNGYKMVQFVAFCAMIAILYPVTTKISGTAVFLVVLALGLAFLQGALSAKQSKGKK